MSADVIPFFVGFAIGLGLCIAALVIVLRSLRPFLLRARLMQRQIDDLQLAKAKQDARRLAEAATRISELRASLRN